MTALPKAIGSLCPLGIHYHLDHCVSLLPIILAPSLHASLSLACNHQVRFPNILLWLCLSPLGSYVRDLQKSKTCTVMHVWVHACMHVIYRLGSWRNCYWETGGQVCLQSLVHMESDIHSDGRRNRLSATSIVLEMFCYIWTHSLISDATHTGSMSFPPSYFQSVCWPTLT